MNKITLAQRKALDVVKDMIDRSNTDVPEFGTKVMTLILGILNVDVNETVTEDLGLTATLVKHPSIDLGNGEPIKTITNDNDELQITIPDWIREKQTPPFSPHTPFPPQVWYAQETEPIQPTAWELRYTTEVSCTGDKNDIVYVPNTADVQYNGDFRDVQTSFNDK